VDGAPAGRGAEPGEARLTEQRTPQRPVESEARDVTLAREGDRSAFERLYRVHVGRVYGLACRMAGASVADDLTQDVFVRAWEKLAGFRGDSQFGTWLYRLAVNLIVEDRRRVFARGRQQDDGYALENAPAEPADAAFAMDFEAAVSRLPPAAREVFVLHDVEGYKHREIARLVGITSGTSKGQLHRARMILRRYLRRETPEAARMEDA
jgi:RNA polymerase sigma factor (sigma-70 family)